MRLSNLDFRLYRNTIIFAFIIFLFCALYSILLNSSKFNLFLINSTFAYIAILLIGLSFAASGISYFFNFLDSKFVYRKYLGIVGFYIALIHIFISLFMLKPFAFPDYYIRNIVPFGFAVFATTLFLIMTVISTPYFAKLLGAELWRDILRLGYLAYIAAILHFALKQIKDWEEWLKYLSEDLIFPPLSLVITVFSSLVIFLRIALFVNINLKSK